jgi:RNA polymerase sigma factor (TIGR02999 family)
MSDVTEFLAEFAGPDPQTAAKLLPLIYEELKRVAAARIAREKPGQTLTATSLVHEAYLRISQNADRQWSDKNHFFIVAARAMQRVLLDNARRKGTLKRGGGFERQELDSFQITWEGSEDRLLAVTEALEKLEALYPRKAELVRLRFFAGLKQAEIAEALGISAATAKNDWVFARAWLGAELNAHQ